MSEGGMKEADVSQHQSSNIPAETRRGRGHFRTKLHPSQEPPSLSEPVVPTIENTNINEILGEIQGSAAPGKPDLDFQAINQRLGIIDIPGNESLGEIEGPYTLDKINTAQGLVRDLTIHLNRVIEEEKAEEQKAVEEKRPTSKRFRRAKTAIVAAFMSLLPVACGGDGPGVIPPDHTAPTSPSVTVTEPTPTVTEPSPTETDTPEAIKSQENAVKAIKEFFELDPKELLSKWAQNNIVISDERSAIDPEANQWEYLPHLEEIVEGGSGFVRYEGNPRKIDTGPQLSALNVVDTNMRVEYLGVNIAVYEKAGKSFVAVGMLPNPQLMPTVDGKPLDKLVVIFQVLPDNPDRLWAYTTVKDFDDSQKNVYAFSGNAKSFEDLAPAGVKKAVKKQIGNVIYVFSYENKVLFELAKLGPTGRYDELLKKMRQIEKSQGWLQTKPGIELPEKAPYVGLGELQNATKLL